MSALSVRAGVVYVVITITVTEIITVITRMWADAQRDGRPPEYRWRGALCESSVIPFLVRRRKVWLTPSAGVPSSNAANIGERKTWDTK